MNLSLWIDREEFKLNLEEKSKNTIQVSLGGKTYSVTAEFLSPNELVLNIDGKIHNIIINSNSVYDSVYVRSRFFKIEKKSALRILREDKGRVRRREIKTSMPGKIVKILAGTGEAVSEGQPVLVLEAMKMQNEVKAPQSGRILRIGPRPGENVETGALLFVME
jgi:biotin carboxyl carrier protein